MKKTNQKIESDVIHLLKKDAIAFANELNAENKKPTKRFLKAAENYKKNINFKN